MTSSILSMKMAVERLRERIEILRKFEENAREERHLLELQVEEDEGRTDSLEASWLRAWISKNYDECNRITAQRTAAYEADISKVVARVA